MLRTSTGCPGGWRAGAAPAVAASVVSVSPRRRRIHTAALQQLARLAADLQDEVTEGGLRAYVYHECAAPLAKVGAATPSISTLTQAGRPLATARARAASSCAGRSTSSPCAPSPSATLS